MLSLAQDFVSKFLAAGEAALQFGEGRMKVHPERAFGGDQPGGRHLSKKIFGAVEFVDFVIAPAEFL